MRVVVLQSEEQVRHYSDYERLSDDIVIPIGPDAMHSADKFEWQICNLGGLWSSSEYQHARENSEKRIADLIDSLNAYSVALNSNIALEIGHYYAFQLYGFIGHLHYNYFIARSIAQRYPSAKLLIYTKQVHQVFDDPNPDPDSILAEVTSASGIFANEKIEFRYIRHDRQTATRKDQILGALPLRWLVRMRELRSRWRLRHFGKARHRLLLVGGGYDWLKICRDESFRQTFSIHMMSELMPIIKIDPPQEFTEMLDRAIASDGVVPFCMDRYATKIYTDMLLYAKKFNSVSAAVKRFDAVVTSVFSGPFENFIAHAAAKSDKPVLVWQHGEKGQADEKHIALYTELLFATDYLAYAPAVAALYQAFTGVRRFKNVEAVGSLGKRIDWVGGGAIVYVTGKWMTNSVPFTPLPDPDARIFQAQQAILGYLDTVAGKREVILKANNTRGANRIVSGCSRIHIDFESAFTNLLKTASVIILDTPATTLVESCSTKVPIFVLGGRTNYRQDFLDKIRRRVVWCDTSAELIEKLDSYLSTGQYGADATDNAYLRDYCAAADSREVICRVKESLVKAIQRSWASTGRIYPEVSLKA